MSIHAASSRAAPPLRLDGAENIMQMLVRMPHYLPRRADGLGTRAMDLMLSAHALMLMTQTLRMDPWTSGTALRFMST